MVKIFFGAPGCGKTTLCAYFAQKYRKQALKRAFKHRDGDYQYIFSNAEILDTNPLRVKDLDDHAPPENSLLLIDEAGIDLNSRKTLKLSDGFILYAKKHRHNRDDIFLFSQTWNDSDVVLRRLAEEVWYLKKIGPFTLCRRILKKVEVDNEKHEIVDGYEKQSLIKRFLPPPFGSFSFFLVYRPKYYRYFDSWEFEERPRIPGDKIVGKGRA